MDPEAVQMPGVLLHWMGGTLRGLSSVLRHILGKRRGKCLCCHLTGTKLSAQLSGWLKQPVVTQGPRALPGVSLMGNAVLGFPSI